jgi:hypothetical protein
MHERGFGLILPRLGYASVPQKVARFRQVDLDRPNTHHDALEFPDGQVVLVTTLREGQTATVLQLPAEPEHKAPQQEPAKPAAAPTAATTTASFMA